MKKKKRINPTACKFTVLRQVCNLIPVHLVSKLAREHGSEDHARTFSHWSHVVSLLFAQTSHSLGLNDVCDALSLHSGPLSAVRGATPPSRNGLSHANKTRPAASANLAKKTCFAKWIFSSCCSRSSKRGHVHILVNVFLTPHRTVRAVLSHTALPITFHRI